MSTKWRRWVVLISALGLALGADDVRRSSGSQRAMPEPSAHSGRQVAETSSREFASALVPELELQKLRPRVFAAARGEPFAVRGRSEEPKAATRGTNPRPARTTPQAPPLPYTYLGKLIHEGETVVFLTREDRNYIVRAGETLEERYKIEAVEEDQVVLSYLPLRVRQTLAFESAHAAQGAAHEPTELAISDEASDSSSSGNRADVRDPVALLVAIPDQASIGGEFSVRLGVPAGNDAAAARVALAYDPKLVIPADSGTQTGRLLVDLRGPGVVGAAAPPPTDVRFRVVATKPATTRLRIENPSATDINGDALPLTARRIHSLAIRPAQQTQ